MKKIFLFLAIAMVHAPIRSLDAIQTSLAIERLSQHVRFLKKINTTLKRPLIKVESTLPLDKHELVYWCIKKMHDERCIDVIFDVWSAFVVHSTDVCTDDCLFVHNFAALVYVIYMNIITITARTSFHDFSALYIQIAELPIEELLDLLDIFYQRLGIILQAYSAATSYTMLLQDYWWVPAAILAASCTKILHWYLHHAYYRSSR